MLTRSKDTSKARRRHSRPIDHAAQRYEAEKADLASKGLSPIEYARACLEAARRVGL